MAKSVTIFTTPACVYCKMAKEFFKKNKVTYRELDVSKDDKALNDMVDKSGQMGVPVITVDKEVIIGFDEAKLRKALGLKG
ncbi:MAG TPA: glutaredoxin family protein [Candidatus Nanoarchaeia archaeon]|nr:glutaredoxin family protein [Candidatus Nanoarchaeia archaeon]